MGSQQLLLIILSLVLVALLIYSGFQYSGDYYQNFHRKKLVDHIESLHSNAVQYKKKASEYGGGSGSFIGWNAPESQLSSNSYKIRYNVSNNAISFLAEGNVSGWNDESAVKVWVKYTEQKNKSIRYLN